MRGMPNAYKRVHAHLHGSFSLVCLALLLHSMQKPCTQKSQFNDVKKTEHVRYLNEIDEFGDARA